MQKKENAKMREEIDFYDKVIEERTEEVNGDDYEDIMAAGDADNNNMNNNRMETTSNAYNVGMQSKISNNRREMSTVNKNNNRS